MGLILESFAQVVGIVEVQKAVFPKVGIVGNDLAQVAHGIAKNDGLRADITCRIDLIIRPRFVAGSALTGV